MKVLILAFYHGLGHIVRAARVGQELTHLGVDVTFASAGSSASIVKEFGLRHRPISELPPFPPQRHGQPAPPPRGRLRLAEPDYLSRALTEERAAIRESQADFVLVDFRVTGAVSAALEGVPAGWIVNTGFFAHPFPEVVRDVVPALHDLGVDRDVVDRLLGEVVYIPDLSLLDPLSNVRDDGARRALAAVREVRHVGPILRNAVESVPDRSVARDRLEVDQSEPLVFVSLGGSAQGYSYLESILPQLTELGVRAVVVTGPNIDPEDFTVGSSIDLVQTVREPMLWARAADVVVTHGGHTTTMEALSVGTPVLVVPGHEEQRRNAEIVTERRVGTVVDPDDLETSFGPLLSSLIHDANLRRRASEFGVALSRRDGARDLAEHMVGDISFRQG